VSGGPSSSCARLLVTGIPVLSETVLHPGAFCDLPETSRGPFRQIGFRPGPCSHLMGRSDVHWTQIPEPPETIVCCECGEAGTRMSRSKGDHCSIF